MKRKNIWMILGLIAAITFGASACKDDSDDDLDNGNNTTSNDWDLNCTVDLGGEFDVTADASFDMKETTFDATVTTKTIGGAEEVHVSEISGTRSGDVLTVTNAQFTVVSPGGNTEVVTMKTATITINGDNMTGSGTMEVDLGDGNPPVEGTFTVTRTRK